MSRDFVPDSTVVIGGINRAGKFVPILVNNDGSIAGGGGGGQPSTIVSVSLTGTRTLVTHNLGYTPTYIVVSSSGADITSSVRVNILDGNSFEVLMNSPVSGNLFYFVF